MDGEEFDYGADRGNMRKVLEESHQQVREGSKLAEGIKVEGDINKIVIAGMGGSALPGEVLQSDLDLEIPIFIAKNYFLPRHINSKSLVFAISYSGNTEETLSAYDGARRSGAKIVAICSGGKLRERARRDKVPLIIVPGGIQPRNAIAYQFFSLLQVLVNSGIIADQREEIETTIEALRNQAFEENAKEIALMLKGKIPLIYSSEKMKAVAYKWKISLNESGKVPAFYNVFSELNHNEIEGFAKHEGNYHVIILRDAGDYIRIRKRMGITKKIIIKRGIPVTEIEIKGKSRLAKIFSGIIMGDWTAYHLALLNGTDPTPVDMIEGLKKEL